MSSKDISQRLDQLEAKINDAVNNASQKLNELKEETRAKIEQLKSNEEQ